jgi:hypothetical protein
MNLRKLCEMRYDEASGTHRMSGQDSFEHFASVYIPIGDPEHFLNAIRRALRSNNGEQIPLDKED